MIQVMGNKDKILPFEELLARYVLADYGQANSTLVDKESDLVFSSKLEVSLTEGKRDKMLLSLYNVLSKPTLGMLIGEALEKSEIDSTEIQSVTGLTSSVLTIIKDDMAFTNTIPVKSLARLLKFLELPLSKVKVAIEQTYDKLITESHMFNAIPVNVQPAFRKGAKKGEHMDISHKKANESYLYQNKEALDMYINRLSELYNDL